MEWRSYLDVWRGGVCGGINLKKKQFISLFGAIHLIYHKPTNKWHFDGNRVFGEAYMITAFVRAKFSILKYQNKKKFCFFVLLIWCGVLELCYNFCLNALNGVLSGFHG